MANNTVDVILKLTNQFSGPAKDAGTSGSSLLSTMGQLNQAFELVEKVGGAAYNFIAGQIQKGIELNEKFAQTQIQIAGTVKAFGLVKDFKEGQQAASALYDTMEGIAAPLPGAVDDYVNVFQRALPATIQAFNAKGGGSLKEMAEFTSKFTAVAIANNVDAAQAAADIPRLLQGHAGADVIAWQKMQGLIGATAKEYGLAANSAEEFNKLKPEQRLKIMQKVVENSKDTIDAYGETMDAQKGTLESYQAKFMRTFGAKAYAGAVGGLKSINALLDKYSVQLDWLAKFLGDQVAGAFEAVARVAKAALEPIMGIVGGTMTAAGGQGGLLSGIVSLLMGIATVVSPVATLIAATFMSMAQNTEFVNQLFSGLSDILQMLSPIFTNIGAGMRLLGDLIAAFLMPVLLGLVSGVQVILSYALPVFDNLFTMFQTFVDFVKPYVEQIGEALGRLLDAVGNFLGPVVGVLGQMIQWVGSLLGEYLGPVIEPVANFFSRLLDALADLLNSIGNWISKEFNVQRTAGSPAKQQAEAHGFLGAFSEQIRRDSLLGALGTKGFDLTKIAGGAATSAAAKTPKGRGGTVNDFRGSNFNITQKFEEGFDPARIATAFSEDLAKLADARLDSSLATAFSTR